MISEQDLNRIRETLIQFQLPVTVKQLDEETLIAITQNDKKMEAGKIKFILLDGIGHAVIDSTVTKEEMLLKSNYGIGE